MFSDNLTSKSNKENCPDNLIHNDDPQSALSSKDKDINGQELYHLSKSTSQIPDIESEVLEISSLSTLSRADKVNDTTVETTQLDEETKKVFGEDADVGKQKDITLHPDTQRPLQR